MQNISVLGTTGSIGQSTLNLLAQHPEKFHLFAVSGHQRLSKLLEICQKFKPDYAAVPEESAAQFKQQLQDASLTTQVVAGTEGLSFIAQHTEVDQVVAAIVGSAGLVPTLAAVQAGKRVLLANKEALVMAGELVMRAVTANQATLLPIDSEHNAIFQCLPADYAQRSFSQQGIEKLILTASGGPFFGRSAADLQDITPAQAVAHPNWSMGQKISVDSATLMNKGLELIEACWLFNAQPEQVEVVIHPQSLIHSMVSYSDGSVLAQLGQPDMRTPIAYALAWPERLSAGVAPLDFLTSPNFTFSAPDNATFPCLNLARQAFSAGGTAPLILNAANEVAVAAFLAGKLKFLQIAEVIERCLDTSPIQPANELELLLSENVRIQHLAAQAIQQLH